MLLPAHSLLLCLPILISLCHRSGADLLGGARKQLTLELPRDAVGHIWVSGWARQVIRVSGWARDERG